MIIEREAGFRLAKNSYEPKTLVDQPINEKLDPTGRFVLLKAFLVQDLYQDAHYDWTVKLNFSEIAAVLKAVAGQIETDSKLVREAFKDCIPEMSRLLACAAEGLGRPGSEEKVNQV
jgi:hypothetical protein